MAPWSMPEPTGHPDADLDRAVRDAVREVVETVPTWALPSVSAWALVGERLDEITVAVERGSAETVLDAIDRLWVTAPAMARTEVTDLVAVPADIATRLERLEADARRLRRWSRRSSPGNPAAH